jgi:hypothetical protein
MMAHGDYSEHQIETVRQQTTIVTDKSGKQKKVASGTVGAVKGDFPPPSNPLIGWKGGNSSLPPGWKIKRHEYANQTVYFYMSPKNDIIKSRRAVIDYMFRDGDYTEKDFNIVISGAKQRKVALQELYDAKLRRRARRKKRSRSDATDEYEEDEDDEDDEEEETDENKIDSDEELDPVEDDDKFEDAKKCHKKNKPDKEPVLPTRRSGRIRIKEERQREEEEEQDSGAEDSESDSECAPTPPAGTGKRRTEDSDPESVQPEPKRKRGRPPKALSQSFELIELKGESEEEMIADTLLKVEQNMGDSLVKLDSSLFKVELSSQEDIKDFDLASGADIKLEGSAGPSLHNSIKEEFKFAADQNLPNSIHCNQDARDKVTVSEFYVDSSEYSASTKFVRENPYKSSAAADAADESAYAVVVNVLRDIVSSISD